MQTARRCARRLGLVAAVLALSACGGGGGGDDTSSESLRSRLLPASEVPGYKQHRVYTWEDPIDFTVQGLAVSQNTDPSDVVEKVRDAGFSAGSGMELESEDGSSFVAVVVAKLGSADDARQLGDEIRREGLKLPCYGRCSERPGEFAVPGIPGAAGVQQVPASTPPGREPTASDAESEPGAPHAFVAYGVGFTVDDHLYLVGGSGEPGKFHKATVVRAAQKLYRRVAGAGNGEGARDY